MAVWTRDQFVAGGAAGEVALIALSSTKLPDPLPVSRGRHGMPEDGDGAQAVALVARDRAEDPAWFTEQVLGPFADLIASDLGPEAAAAALAAEHAYVIEAQLADPDDLGHVQAAWALAKCVCEEGAVVVVDVYAARAHFGAEVAALRPDRAFDVMHEVTLFFEELDDGSLAAWSLGLRKFGRPDLVVLGIAPDSGDAAAPGTFGPVAREPRTSTSPPAPEPRAFGATDAALLLRDLASSLAAGERVEPGDVVAIGDRSWRAARFAPEQSPRVAVDGDAILLAPAPSSAAG